MNCLNLNIPQIAKDYEELTQVFNDDKIAYGLLAQNNGYNLDLTPQGKESKLFKQILKLPEINNNRFLALRYKAKAYTDSFLDFHGDWLNTEKEPSVSDVKKEFEIPVKSTEYKSTDIPFIYPTSKEELDTVLNEINSAIQQGVTAFVKRKDSNIVNEIEKELSDNIKQQMISKGFDYIENEDAGFFIKKQTIKNIVPKFKGKMTFSYGNNKRNDIKSTTTLEAIKNGERTATTRYESDGNINYWKQIKVGDIVEFEGQNNEKVLVKITKPLYKLKGSGLTIEDWSKLEGWSTNYFNIKVKPKVDEAWQMQFKVINQFTEEEVPSEKYTAKLYNLLENSSNLFAVNGIEDAKEDKYIEHLNANLFENILDTKRLISKMEFNMRNYLKANGLSSHSVITNKKHDGTYWITMTDENYGNTWDNATSPERRNKILTRNREWINRVNEQFKTYTGSNAIYVENVQLGSYLGGRVYIDESVLKEYNAAKYIEYLNSIKQYKALKNNDIKIEEDFTVLPLAKKLKSELSTTRREKSNLVLSGGKNIDINRLDNKIQDLNERIKKLKDTENLNDVYNEAELHFAEIGKLLSAKNMSANQFKTSLDKLELWISAGDFSTNDHVFLDPEEAKSEVLQEKFSDLGRRAQLLMNDLIEQGKVLLTNIVNDKFGTELTYDKVVELGHKLGWFPKNVYSLNRIGHALAQFILASVNESNELAYRESKIASRGLADLYEEMKKTNFDERNFYQQDEEGIYTGRMVHKFSDKYAKAKGKNRTVKFRKEDQLTINPDILINGTDEEKANHTIEIVNNLGELEAKKYIDKALTKYENYLNTRKAHIELEYGITENIPETYHSSLTFEEKRNKIIQAVKEGKTFWIKYKSKRAEDINEPESWRRIDKAVLNKTQTQLSDIEGSSDLKTFNIALDYRFLDVSLTNPEESTGILTEEQRSDLEQWEKVNSPVERIRAIEKSKEKELSKVAGKDTFLEIIPKREKNGKSTGYYDSKFNTIESNSAAYNFYQRAEEITNNAQELFGFKDISRNSLAFVERSTLSKLADIGVANFIRKDIFDSIIGSLTGGNITKEEIDPITKKPIKKIKVQTDTIDQLINRRYEAKIEAFKKINEDLPTKEERKVMYKEASEEVMNKMQFDNKNTSLFTSLNLLNFAALSYKHASMIEDTVNLAMTYLPKSTVNTGVNIVDSKGNSVGQEYIDNLQDMVNYTLDVAYYKTSKQDTSTNLIPLYTPENKKVIRELRNKLKDPKVSKSDKELIKEQINDIQKETKHVTTNSLVRGFMSFLRLKGMGWNIPAAFANLAYGKITNLYKSVEGRMFNFKDFAYAEKAILVERNKFNKVIENYNIVGDVLYEFKTTNRFEENKGWFFKVTKAVKPYAMQTATEKSNQGVVMIAMMKHQMVTNKEGQTKSLWEAIDSNGVLSDEWKIGNKSGANAVASMVAKINSQVEEIHGDYKNPLLIKNTMAGQSLGMFRLWFFEVFHSRFGPEKIDYIRGIETKGRYRTILDLAKTYGFNPKKIYTAWKNNELSEVDKVNMKVNLMEFATMVVTFGLYALAKSALCGDEKKCHKASMTQLTVLNLSKKVMQDVTFYINPNSWGQFIGNPTAMTGLLNDLGKLMELSYIELFGEEEDAIYKTGTRKGENKFWVFTKSQLPFVNSVERMKRFGDELTQTQR